MIIDYLDVVGVAIGPSETNAPLIIYSDTVLAGALATELFEMVPRRNAQVFEHARGVDRNEFPQHYPVEIARKAPDGLARE